MSDPTMPERSLSAMTALAQAWRGDWADFDGRTLRAQLADIADFVRAEVRGEDVGPRIAGWAEACSLDLEQGCWKEWRA